MKFLAFYLNIVAFLLFANAAVVSNANTIATSSYDQVSTDHGHSVAAVPMVLAVAEIEPEEIEEDDEFRGASELFQLVSINSLNFLGFVVSHKPPVMDITIPPPECRLRRS